GAALARRGGGVLAWVRLPVGDPVDGQRADGGGASVHGGRLPQSGGGARPGGGRGRGGGGVRAAGGVAARGGDHGPGRPGRRRRRARHVPGLRAVEGVEIVAVCNRRPESTEAAARELGIARTFARWEDLVADRDIDAVVIGTWPYLHAPITLAALGAGKHVLTEARMAMNAAEAHAMLAAARRHTGLVAQIVPSPFGLTADAVVRELIAGGYLGQLREVQVVHRTAALADPTAALHWRQDAALSGVNMLTLGIYHETLLRWLPQPVRVMAQAHAFIAERVDPDSGAKRAVGTPDSVQVLC